MANENRRNLVIGVLCATVLSTRVANSQTASATAAEPYNDPAAADAWMKAWINAPAAISGPFHMGKFSDRMYYILDEIGWEPSGDQRKIPTVKVPKGFVCDLTSIPRVFWSILPPDGSYAFAAVIHDYLYWQQSGTREEADLVFRYAMEDLKVSPVIVSTIHFAVEVGGAGAWERNASLRKGGERRFLKKYPGRADVTWPQWSAQPGTV